MIVLRIDETEKGPAIVLSAEALELLGASTGQTVGLQVTPSGEVTIAARDMSFEARRQRGRAFLKRYDKTFQALAK
ncbi:AbrB/MazE/SpoVT family DNA-binding domain-containing protein [Phenylobacterium sp.]|uniref:AbrB/MazE/SpoVT family DNA-binding domain-containing protein n=1 Tax=Phenylobacterium sp. TaxID=1871053 RepID=UPI00301D6EE6